MSITQLPSWSTNAGTSIKLVPADLEEKYLCVGIIKPGKRIIYYNENRSLGLPKGNRE